MAVRAASCGFPRHGPGGRRAGRRTGAATRAGADSLSGRDRRPGRRRRRADPLRHGFDAARSMLRAFTLADPYRVVIDLPQVTFQAAAQDRRERPRPGQGVPLRPGDAGRLAHRARRGQAGARSTRPSWSTPRRAQPARLVLDLAADRPRELPAQRSRSTADRPAPAQPPAAQRAAAGHRRRSAAARRARSGPWRHRQRHQAPGGEIMEKDIVLDFASRLREQLERTGKYRVVMTRTDDTFIPLGERVRMARMPAGRAVRLDPCRCAAEEARAMRRARPSTRCRRPPPTPRPRGSPRRRTAPTSSPASTCRHEPDDVADILIDLAQRETKAFSMQFAADAGRRHEGRRRGCTRTR